MDQEPGSFPTNSVSIQMSRNQADVEGMEVFLSQAAMREVMFDEGPFGYPVMKLQTGALIGDVLVYVTGTDQSAADAYLEAMVGCAVASGFLAKGVDAETLRTDP